MYRRILVGFSGSEPSRKAFDVALQRAANDGAELFVVAVTERHVIGDDVETRAALDDSIEHFTKLLSSLGNAASSKGVRASFEVAVGNPVDQLARHADRHGVNLIVVGHHGSKLRQRLFGSVSNEIERYPGCPVLVVR